MPIRTEKTFKVYEQANGAGCGAVLASFTAEQGGQAAALAKARELARQSPPTRYYVAAFTHGVYLDATGGEVTRTY